MLLRSAELIETVPMRGLGIVAANQPAQAIALGAPPYMDDLFNPLSDTDPARLIERVIQAAKMNSVFAALGFVIYNSFVGQNKVKTSSLLYYT